MMHFMKIDILFENDRYVIINKPAGLVVHADGKTIEPNVAEWFAQQYPASSQVGEPLVLSSGEVIARPGIVHRIDRETSGVLVLARTPEAFAHLKGHFQSRDVDKTYHVFVYGNVKKDYDTIDRPIGRSRKDFRMWSAQRLARGELREAITDYAVIARGEKATFLEAKPHTGRTHQIRVHFKAINHPVVCDKLYAPKHPPLFGLDRLALHARSIAFADIDGSTISVTAPYPEDFERAVSAMQGERA